MALFYFDICNQGDKIADMVGVECDTIGSAFEHAKVIIGNIRDAFGAVAADWSSWALEVQYSDHSELFTLPFTMADVRI
ncbi:DUF6894 family protein [Methylobacterium sp. P5_C11]